MAYQDGNFTNAIQDGPARVFYPFINAPTKDTTTKGTVRSYVVVPSSYTPAAALSTDPADNTQYLIEETELTVEGGLGRYARTYCKVPGQQIEPTSVVYTRPEVPGSGQYRNYGTEASKNSALFYQADTNLRNFDVYGRKAVSSDEGVNNLPTGGTYALTFNGNTTSNVNYNATSATLKTAIDSLTTVTNYGGLASVSGNYNDAAGFTITFNNYNAATLVTSSLTCQESALSSSVTTSNSGWTQAFVVSATLTATPRVYFTPTTDASGLTGRTGGSASISEDRIFNSATYAKDLLQITSTTPITGGTFTVTIFGQTTSAIAYNETLTNVQSALNSLSNVVAHGSVTVTAFGGASGTVLASGGLSISFYFDFGIPPIQGSYTSNIFGSSTASINANSNVATIQTTFNNVTAVYNRGGATISGNGYTNNAISFTATFSANAFSTTSNLTPTPSSAVVTLVSNTSGRQQTLKLTGTQVSRTLTFTNPHQIEAGDEIYLKMGSNYYFNRSDFTYLSATQISINPAVSPWFTNTAITEGGKFVGKYAPGAVEHKGKAITDFYLPGVTPGITSIDDIPDASPAISDAIYLNAVASDASYVNYATSSIEQWRGPILSREQIQIAPNRSIE